MPTDDERTGEMPTGEAPVDPRSAWGLPPLGTLTARESVDEIATRLLAPNPSPMTLDGTNTYVVGDHGSGEALVIDPGPDDERHWVAIRDEVAARDAAVVAVFVTHHHVDHAEAARSWARRWGCRVVAADPQVAGAEGTVVADGDHLPLARTPGCDVVATPGHTTDHLALRLPTGALITGDHVLGRGTSVVTHPDGDMAAYLASLRKVRQLGPDALLPGHGPVMRKDPQAVLAYYEVHREYREHQILEALGAGPKTVSQLVDAVYPLLAAHLREPASASTRAALAALEARRVVGRWPEHTTPDGPYALVGRRGRRVTG